MLRSAARIGQPLLQLPSTEGLRTLTLERTRLVQRALQGLGRNEDARLQLEEATRRWPESGSIRHALARVSKAKASKGKTKKATSRPRP